MAVQRLPLQIHDQQSEEVAASASRLEAVSEKNGNEPRGKRIGLLAEAHETELHREATTRNQTNVAVII